MKEPAHLALHPFGQIPTYEEGDLVLFETGAIILHIAEHHAGLLPADANARVRTITWMFAALNTVEPPIVEREAAWRSEEHTSELQSLMRISYAVFCLKKKNKRMIRYNHIYTITYKKTIQ